MADDKISEGIRGYFVNASMLWIIHNQAHTVVKMDVAILRK